MRKVRTKAKLHFALGESGGTMSRFKVVPKTEPVPRKTAALIPGHAALVSGRTIFPSRVFGASERSHILMRGFHNSKIGDRIMKGPWAGMRIYTMSLEERATCPRSCSNWSECYGNALPVAVRFRLDAELLEALEAELVTKGDEHPDGFAVRAHVLGDFANLEYVDHWRLWMQMVPALHVWGYTAHPAGSEIGTAVLAMNDRFAGRWAFRTSVAPDAEAADWQAATTWDKPRWVGGALRGAGGLVCPVEMGASASCGTCALCWSPAAAGTRIVFLGHGMTRAKTVVQSSEPRPGSTMRGKAMSRNLPEQEVCRLYLEGQTMLQIAVHFGCSTGPVWACIRRNGLSRARGPSQIRKVERDAMICARLRAGGTTMAEVARELGITCERVRQIALREGITAATYAATLPPGKTTLAAVAVQERRAARVERREALSARVVELRKQGMKQESIAEVVGISQSLASDLLIAADYRTIHKPKASNRRGPAPLIVTFANARKIRHDADIIRKARSADLRYARNQFRLICRYLRSGRTDDALRVATWGKIRTDDALKQCGHIVRGLEYLSDGQITHRGATP